MDSGPAPRGASRNDGSTHRPYKRRLAARAPFHVHRDTASAAGSEAFDQPLQQLRAGGMIVGYAVHQLPALLDDLIDLLRLPILRDVILGVEQRKDKFVERGRISAG